MHTSTVAVWGRQKRVPFDETAAKNGAGSRMNYAPSKLRGEDEARAAIGRGLEVVIMNPCHIVGCYDTNGWSKMIPLVAEGKLPAVPPGRGSFCDAGAVARAHVAAVSRGRVGENYLLGGPEAKYTEVVRVIGELVGKKAPAWTVPLPALAALATVGRATSLVTRRQPFITPEMVEGLVQIEVADSSKAERELGYARSASARCWRRRSPGRCRRGSFDCLPREAPREGQARRRRRARSAAMASPHAAAMPRGLATLTVRQPQPPELLELEPESGAAVRLVAHGAGPPPPPLLPEPVLDLTPPSLPPLAAASLVPPPLNPPSVGLTGTTTPPSAP